MKSLISVIFALSIVAAMCDSALAACGPNQHVPACRPCAVTCADRDKICTTVCTPNSNCYCKNGYLKKGNRCVPISQC
ncbi:unnamed protein product [Acanthoscelides obtectus]|uniref:TIL domain-containing protein n=1 Tax=Acanthoscelides obtectus TaxID=200917 RepID=A0A9P0KJZ6_ACAOB|nr:unnamed protein product [Acanthoscelides obtectus]CAK1666720.1 hypothetical protein AOBTE_LOCUS25452 [Acanthoscelides obtectus]